MGGAAALFLTGWMISRGASLQKYWFKRWPERKFLWFEPEVIEAGNRKILCSGFWGAARHFNYFGEGTVRPGDRDQFRPLRQSSGPGAT